MLRTYTWIRDQTAGARLPRQSSVPPSGSARGASLGQTSAEMEQAAARATRGRR